MTAPEEETTRMLLATGETLQVNGALDQIAKDLENAARSSAGTLVWLDESSSGERLGVAPAQVVWVRRGRD